MDDLIAFVAARLDEDEAAAKAAWGVEWDWRYVAQPSGERPSIAHTVHIARHDPARELRQVMATRAVLTSYEMSVRMLGEGLSRDKLMLLRAHAVIWEDHPEYRPEWKP